MTFEIISTTQRLYPALRFIGRRYTLADQAHGSYGALWDDWMIHQRFAPLLALQPVTQNDGGFIGFMRMKGFGSEAMRGFEYWIGLFFAPNVAAPAGYEALDLPASRVGLAQIQGQLSEIFGMEPAVACWERLVVDAQAEILLDRDWHYEFELYNRERFDKPDAEGRRILDYGYYIL